MAAARYWRLVGIETYGYFADLELSEIALYESTARVDGSATLTATVAPVSGSLANLKDGDLGTVARFAGVDVFASGFAFCWDFGAGVTKQVDELRVAAGASAWRWMYQFSLQSSVDGASWITELFGAGLAYPGDSAYFTASGAVDVASAKLVLHFDGENDATVFTDSSSNSTTVQAQGGAKISTALSKFGGSCAYFNGGGAFLKVPRQLSSGAWTVHGWVCTSGLSITQIVWAQFVANPGRCGVQIQQTTGVVQFFVNGLTGGNLSIYHATPLTIGTLAHLAVTRDAAGYFNLWVNGIGSTPAIRSGDIADAPFTLGVLSESLSGDYFYGYIDELLIHEGALWTSNFTPPLSALANYRIDTPFGQPAATKRIALSQTAPATLNPCDIGETRLSYHNPLVLAKDMQYGGRGLVTGTVKQKALPSNTPLGRRVRLVSECDNALVRETWSDMATGDYEFRDVDPTLVYSVITYDYAQNYRAVIADNLTLANGGVELMP